MMARSLLPSGSNRLRALNGGLWWTIRALALTALASCIPTPIVPDIETQVSFLNFSRTQYVVIGIRPHGSDGPFMDTPLLAPGVTQRSRFIDLIGERCPGTIDLQVFLYRRVNRDVPIGLDPGEQVEPVPIAAARFDNVPVCDVQTLETFTIVNWDTPEGTGRVKIAQCSDIDAALQTAGRLGPSGAWEFTGVDPALGATTPASLAPSAALAGQVTRADGRGVADVIILLRPRYRTALDCANADDPAATGYADPIVFTTTDAQGRFRFDRPAGVYRLEFYSDTVAFRPGQIEIETPRQDISVLAEDL